jgi:hypothetical protein
VKRVDLELRSHRIDANDPLSNRPGRLKDGLVPSTSVHHYRRSRYTKEQGAEPAELCPGAEAGARAASMARCVER